MAVGARPSNLVQRSVRTSTRSCCARSAQWLRKRRSRLSASGDTETVTDQVAGNEEVRKEQIDTDIDRRAGARRDIHDDN